jgi:putative ABC transport system permease protein
VGALDTVRETRQFTAAAWRRPAVAGLAMLAAVLSFSATAAARTDLSVRTKALHTLVNSAPPTTAMVDAQTDLEAFGQAQNGARPPSFTYARARISNELAPTLPLTTPDASWSQFLVTDRTVKTPASAAAAGGQGAQMRLVYRDTYTSEGYLLAGRWPTDSLQAPDSPLEAVLSSATAKRLGLQVGSAFGIQADKGQANPTRLVVVGIVAPQNGNAPFWTSDPRQLAPDLVTDRLGDTHWGTEALIGAGQVETLEKAFRPDNGEPTDPGGFQLSWSFPLDLSHLDADQAAPLADRLDAMAGIEDTLTYDLASPIPVSLSTPLTPVLRSFADTLSKTDLEQSMPAYGLAMIAAIAGALLAYAAVDRRRAQIDMMRARGAATWYLTLEALADGFVTALPASAGAFALGFTVPGIAPPWIYRVAIIVTAWSTLGPALITAVKYRPRRIVRSQSVVLRRPARFARQRRFIVQGALAIGCLAGIDLIRSQGLAPNGTVNPYAAAAPVLAAGLAALVTINVLPLALRGVRRQALPRRGIVALLGVARAAYEPGTGQAATFVLTTASCTADLAVALASLARHQASGPLADAAAANLNALAALAVVAACAVAAIAVRLGAAGRRAADRRLATMGMTAGQARAIAAIENVPPALVGALTGALVTVPLLRIVGPALGVATIPASAATLVLPALAVALPAAAASLAGSRRRGAAQ